jgi:hypothetical protein
MELALAGGPLMFDSDHYTIKVIGFIDNGQKRP